MALLAQGRITKQIAGEIGISAMTVRIHRSQVISKMGARSAADLVRMADKLGPIIESASWLIETIIHPLIWLASRRKRDWAAAQNPAIPDANGATLKKGRNILTPVPLISIVDDDDSVRLATGGLVETLGYDVETFESCEAFLGSEVLDKTRCLIADVQMRGMNGPELQEHLIKSGINIPIIFITAFPSSRTCDRVTERGAIAYLTKPFDRATLQKRIKLALGDSWNVPRSSEP
jgi:FixJ family two-component response regulator